MVVAWDKDGNTGDAMEQGQPPDNMGATTRWYQDNKMLTQASQNAAGTSDSSKDISGDGSPMADNSERGSGGGAGGNEIGNASIVRLWSSSLYGQSSWLLTFAALSIIVFAKKINIKKLTLKQGVFSFWIIWLFTMFIFFSFAGFYHRYYLCMFAPALSIISGVGFIQMLKEFREKTGWKQFILPIALITTMAIEIKYVFSYTELRIWLIPIMGVTAVASLLLMVKNYFKPKKLTALLMSIFMLIAMLAAPFYWALTPVMYVPNSTMPYAGPELASNGNKDGSMNSGNSSANLQGELGNNYLEEYLVTNYKEGSFLVVAQRANTVAQYIIDTGLPAYAYGGFLGSDNSLTLDNLKAQVEEGKITYFLVSDQNGGGEGSSDIISYVKEKATLIDPSEYTDSSAENTKNTMGGGSTSLYCFK